MSWVNVGQPIRVDGQPGRFTAVWDVDPVLEVGDRVLWWPDGGGLPQAVEYMGPTNPARWNAQPSQFQKVWGLPEQRGPTTPWNLTPS